MAAVCAVLILGQIYFDLSLPDRMSELTVLIKTPGSAMDDILRTGLDMLGCTLASAVLCVVCGHLTARTRPQRSTVDAVILKGDRSPIAGISFERC